MFYPVYVKDGEIIGFGEVCDEDFHPPRNILRDDGVIEVYPIHNDTVKDKYGTGEGKWLVARQNVELWTGINEAGNKVDQDRRLHVVEGKGGTQIRQEKFLIERKTVWTKNLYAAKTFGSEQVDDIMEPLCPPMEKMKMYPKSIHLVEDCVLTALNSRVEKDGLVLDYFGGTGTTGHAVINLNRKDGGNRKFVLVEMGDHFETILKPRIQRVSFCNSWNKGKPDSFESGTSQFLKYLKLESYEDALGSIQVKQTTLLDDFEQVKSEYLMKYALSSKSGPQYGDNLLEEPSKATMTVSSNSGTREVPIDLIETFNLLIGVNVDTLQFAANIVWETGSLQDGKTVLIIWRSHEEFDDKTLNQWFSEKGFNSEEQDYDIVYVNGDTTLLTRRKDEHSWECRDIDVDFNSHMFDSWE
jgi:adenine-specific DNA-methyltransferase